MKNIIQLGDALTMANDHKDWIQRDGLDGVAPPVLTVNHGPGSAAQTLDDLRRFWGDKTYNAVINEARECKATQIKIMALCAQFGVTGYAVELLLEKIAGRETGNDVPGAKHGYYTTRYNYGRVLQWVITGDEKYLTEA